MSLMAKTPAEKIFERYNPASDVVRAPRGRGQLRSLLNDYACAAVNLYGIISRDEFVELFNSQQVEQTTAAEVYTLLLPNVLKSRVYLFYKDYIIHRSLEGNYQWVDHLEREQQDKPRYVPPEEEFLEYADIFYEDSDYWEVWFDVFLHHFGFESFQAAAEIRTCLTANLEITHATTIMEKHGLTLPNEEAEQEFMGALMDAMNNCRSWENKGHIPTELFDKRAEVARDEPSQFYAPAKPKRNEPCVCGSGKKYKLCCLEADSKGTAQLSQSDYELFTVTLLGLLSYVNGAEGLADFENEPESTSEDVLRLHKIRDALWDKPSLIADYLASDTSLSDDEVRLLQSWLHNHINSDFAVVAYTPQHAVFCQMLDSGPKLFAVKGVAMSVASTLCQQPPVLLNAVLLPFKDVIIHDTFMVPYDMDFSPSFKRLFEEARAHAEAEDGITTRL